MTRPRVRRLLRDGYLRLVSSDVFIVGAAPATWHRHLMAGVLQLGDGALVSGEAAASLHNFDTFPPGRLEYLVGAGWRNRNTAGRVHSTSARLEATDAVVVASIPCTSPTRTLFDLAAVVSRPRMEHAIDSALRDQLTTEAELLQLLERVRQSGRNGVRRFEEALGVTSGPAAHSVLERRFLRLVEVHDLPVPRSQVTYVDADERFVARVDFVFEEVLIVELDGHRFHTTRAQRQRDHQRRNALERAGKHVLVFTYEDVRDRPAYVVREVRAALAALTPRRRTA